MIYPDVFRTKNAKAVNDRQAIGAPHYFPVFLLSRRADQHFGYNYGIMYIFVLCYLFNSK